MTKYSLALCIAILLIGCKKDEAVKGDFRFSNKLSQEVTVNVYPSLDDYYANTNLVKTVQVGADASGTIPLASFTKDKDYYVDWYTTDYKYSNWSLFNGVIKEINTYITINPSKNASYTIQSGESIYRQLFINGNGTGSQWVSIHLPEHEKIKMSFGKDYKYSMERRGKVTSGAYQPQSISVGIDESGSELRGAFVYRNYEEDPHDLWATRDTAFLKAGDPHHPENDIHTIMVKQK